ncbi:MAG: ABC transporter permease [Proteobacteria bacterium]|nr:ABC transporter permease [Pseudomonadota bacterium]
MLAVFYLYPLAQVVWLSFTVPQPGLANYALLFTNPAVQRILWTTSRICVVTTAITMALGYLVAYVILHVTRRTEAWMLFFVLLSFWISILVRAFAWVALLHSRGVVNTLLMDWHVIGQPLALVRNELGVVIGMVHYMIPYAVLPLYANMKGIDARLVPAARGLGASPATAFLRVYLPLSLPGIVGAGILVFIFSLGFYVTPAILGGGKTVMIAEYIALQVVETLQWGLGTMLATSLLVIIFLMLALMARFVNPRRMFGAA